MIAQSIISVTPPSYDFAATKITSLPSLSNELTANSDLFHIISRMKVH